MRRDDPRWTALALGEPAPDELIDALSRDPDAREEVARTRALGHLLTAMYREERRPRRSARPWLLVAAAAVLALVALWTLRNGGTAPPTGNREGIPMRSRPSPAAGEIQGSQIVITNELE
jgi:hypothetical protein